MTDEEAVTANDIISDRIREIMVEQGLTQQDVGGMISVHQVTISKRLTGQVKWTVDELTRVAAILAVDLDRILPVHELQRLAS